MMSSEPRCLLRKMGCNNVKKITHTVTKDSTEQEKPTGWNDKKKVELNW